ncbi:MAG: ABC transporter ATP-binding protein [Spirochaetota bacterium]
MHSELALEHVSFAYPTATGAIAAVERLSMRIERGEFVSIVGPSGCGKTTVLRLMAGFLLPDEGEVLDEGERVVGPDWRRGLVFQKPELYPWLTVEGNVAFGPRMRGGLSPKERSDQVRHYLELVKLWDFRAKRPYELSGGMQQRVALARALANEPHILLLDEPFAALDALTREHMQDELRRIHERTQCTAVLVTHSVEEAVYLSSRCIALSGRPSRIVAEVPIDLDRSGPHGNRQGREIKAGREFVALRERIMDYIWE